MNTTPQQVWTEKYRPHSIDDLILPDEYKQSFKGKPQNFLFYGSQGNGKTTAMRALADYYTDKHSQLLINASECNGVDTVRSMITEFCTHVSLASSGIKVVMLDEIDYMTTQAQMAMRGTIEKFADVAYFIATCNYPDRLAPSLRDSRFKALNFDFSGEVAKQLMNQYMVRAFEILTENHLTIAQDALVALIQKRYPDMRAIINTMYFVYNSGKKVISIEDVNSYNCSAFAELYDFIVANKDPREHYVKLSQYKGRESDVMNALSGDFCQWCYEKMLNNPNFLCKLGDIAVIAHKYGVESKQSIDPFVTLLACSTELSKFVQWK